MATMEQTALEHARREVAEAVRRLKRTERGRAVAEGLGTLLEGPISGLDGDGWDCVMLLLEAYSGSLAGTVLAALATSPRLKGLTPC